MLFFFQHTLVSPGGGSARGGRRSGEVTPVENQTNDDVYHTWHAGATPPHKAKGSDSSRYLSHFTFFIFSDFQFSWYLIFLIRK